MVGWIQANIVQPARNLGQGLSTSAKSVYEPLPGTKKSIDASIAALPANKRDAERAAAATAAIAAGYYIAGAMGAGEAAGTAGAGEIAGGVTLGDVALAIGAGAMVHGATQGGPGTPPPAPAPAAEKPAVIDNTPVAPDLSAFTIANLGKKRGRRSTNLTGGWNAMPLGGMVGYKTLLGS